MNTIFNINRLVLLLKRYFVENKQRELLFWGIATVFFTLTQQSISITIFMYVSGFIFAARIFKIFVYTPGGMHYLLIPATHLEKLVTSFLLTTIYFFGMFLITSSIGAIIGITAGNLIFQTNNPIYFDLFQSPEGNMQAMQLINKPGLWSIFSSFAIVQAIFTLGSLIFKRNAVGGTILSIFALTLVLGIIQLVIFKLTLEPTNMIGHSFGYTITGVGSLFPGYEIIGEIFYYASIPFLWIVSYFRLTEKQV